MLLIEHKKISPKQVGLTMKFFSLVGFWNNLEYKFYPIKSYDDIKLEYEKYINKEYYTDYKFSSPVSLELLEYNRNKSIAIAGFVQRKTERESEYKSIIIHVYR